MKPPIFIVGCPRSGTTLLYSMLIGAGGFGFYRKETYFYDLAPRFPRLSPKSRRALLERFLAGYLGNVKGLDVEPIAREALARSRTTADFLPRLMDGITSAQQMERWVEGTPTHVLYMNEIAGAVPDALFLHVIRDGRDCALSADRQGWTPPFSWDARHRLGVAALSWEWMVRTGRRFGQAQPACYREVRFEDLVTEPQRVLRDIGRFINHDLEWDRITANRIHALRKPNTSYREERAEGIFNPVGRWKRAAAEDVKQCEELVGPYLEHLGYQLASPPETRRAKMRTRRLRACYLTMFAAKHRLKTSGPLGRFMTSTRVWEEQPRQGEEPVRPIPIPQRT
jgi:hypothetical protein